MGRLIKNHWARLIILSAAGCKFSHFETQRSCRLSSLTRDPGIGQVGASIEGFIWPKVFWDFITKNLDGAVTPTPILQIINLVLGIIALAWEWPLKPLAGTMPHRSIELRLLVYPLSALACALMYQSGDVALYYLIGMGIYFWAYSEGEVCFFF
jgi:thymine-DNA glycosylase